MSRSKPSLFLDEDVHGALANALRKRGYDAIHAVEQRRLGVSDENQLAFATAGDRCLMTFNVGDFVQLHNHWLGEGREHAGIIVSRQLPVGETLPRLLALLQKEEARSLHGQIRFL
jgi:hypothetical protein